MKKGDSWRARSATAQAVSGPHFSGGDGDGRGDGGSSSNDVGGLARLVGGGCAVDLAWS